MSVLEKHVLSDKKAEKVGRLHLWSHPAFGVVLGLTRSSLLQATEEVSKSLVAMKEILYGTNEKEPQTEAVAQLAQELYNSGLLGILIADLQLIDFEVRPKSLLSADQAKHMRRWSNVAVSCFSTSALSHVSSPTARVRKTWLRYSTTYSGVRSGPGHPQWSICALSRTSSSCCSEGEDAHMDAHNHASWLLFSHSMWLLPVNTNIESNLNFYPVSGYVQSDNTA